MSESPFIIGLDCGASYTKVRIYENRQIIFQKDDFPGINMDLISSISFEFLNALKQYPQANYIIALAGLDNEAESEEAFQKWRQLLPGQEVKVISDIELVLWAGSEKGEGIALIAGTGSNCFGRNPQGHTYKTGGMSHLLSDEGSGYDLGLQILHQITKMSDGRIPKTDLLDQTLSFYNQPDLVSLKNYLISHSSQKAEIARCATLILDTPNPIIDSATTELALMVTTVQKNLPNIPNQLFLAGSLFKSEIYLNSLKSKLLNLHLSLVSPLDGILNLASKPPQLHQ